MNDLYIKLKTTEQKGQRRTLGYGHRGALNFIDSSILELSAIIVELKKCGPMGSYKFIRAVTNSKIVIDKLSETSLKIAKFERYEATIRALVHNCNFLNELKKENCNLDALAKNASFSYTNEQTSESISVRNDRSVTKLTPKSIQVLLNDSIELIKKFESYLDTDDLKSIINDFDFIYNQACAVKNARTAEAEELIKFFASEQGNKLLIDIQDRFNELFVLEK